MVSAPRRSAAAAIGNAGCAAPFPGAVPRLTDDPAAAVGPDVGPAKPSLESR